jgi:triacylglycerol lipase
MLKGIKSRYNKIVPVILLLSCVSFSATHVYVIHGYGSSVVFMEDLCLFLRKNGYEVTNWGYKSLKDPIPQVGRQLLSEIKHFPKADTVNFVTHSMGGLVVRSMVDDARGDSMCPAIQKIVMLTPPNKGSLLADFFSRFTVIKWIFGPNLDLLKTDSTSLANVLPKPKGKEIGIIAGARFGDVGYNPLIRGDNDGFLTQNQTRLGVEKDFMVVPEGHMTFMYNATVKENVLSFLKKGRFITVEDVKIPED